VTLVVDPSVIVAALAEQLDASLATLDQRLAAATGPRCTFTTPS
jgi:predicted nucleic acid-binding protein